MKKQIMKRTLSVFLSMVMVLMILPLGLLSVSAEACTHATKTAWIKYDNAQHVRTCDCGSVEYADHNWKQSDTLIDGGSGSGGSSNMGDLEFGDVSIPTTGTVSYYCTDCGATTADTTAEDTHVHTGAWVDSGAKHTRICDVCGETEESNHNWDAGVVVQESTHAVPGKKLYNCTECAATKTELIAVLEGHTWVEVEITNGSLELLPDGTGDSLDWGNIQFGDKAPDMNTITKKWVCSECGTVAYTKPADAEEEILWGDANGDGVVDLNDTGLLAVYLANYSYETGTSPAEIEQGADANGDGIVDLTDLGLLKVYLANYDYNTGSSPTVLGPQK